MLLQKVYSVLRLLDELTAVKLLNFEQYFKLHKFFGFPLKKMGFRLSQGYELDLNSPKTFNEKVMYRHLFERNNLLPMIVDKYRVREYIKEKIGKKYLIPVLQVVEDFDEINFNDLPDEYIIKMSHSSGQNIIFKNNHNHLGYDQDKLKLTINTWKVAKYRFQELIWFVQPIKRRIIIEKLLKDEEGNIPKDYKFYVFNGNVEFIQVDQERFSEHKQNYYDKNWNRTKFSWLCSTGDIDEKPITLEKMLMLAEQLASEFTFMRVDFYTFKEKVYFGELTPCPGGGIGRFKPIEFDKIYGDKWKNDAKLFRDE